LFIIETWQRLESLSFIIAQCRKKDHRYQKILYEQYYGFALKVVFRYIYRYENAVDVVNDGFVKLFRNIHIFNCRVEADMGKMMIGWIRRIMINTAIDELRKKDMSPEIGAIPDDIWNLPDISRNADQLVYYKELVTVIKRLPPSYRVVFNMYVIDGYTHQEIADAIGISVGTSKSSLSKARAHLQKYLLREDIAELGAISI
jgi:RNA polymerase sigma-70 factor (ECF subfamily)